MKKTDFLLRKSHEYKTPPVPLKVNGVPWHAGDGTEIPATGNA